MLKFKIGDKVECRYWPDLKVIGCIGVITDISASGYSYKVKGKNTHNEDYIGYWGEDCLTLVSPSPDFVGDIEFEVSI